MEAYIHAYDIRKQVHITDLASTLIRFHDVESTLNNIDTTICAHKAYMLINISCAHLYNDNKKS